MAVYGSRYPMYLQKVKIMLWVISKNLLASLLIKYLSNEPNSAGVILLESAIKFKPLTLE
jgi:hypothetical protein